MLIYWRTSRIEASWPTASQELTAPVGRGSLGGVQAPTGGTRSSEGPSADTSRGVHLTPNPHPTVAPAGRAALCPVKAFSAPSGTFPHRLGRPGAFGASAVPWGEGRGPAGPGAHSGLWGLEGFGRKGPVGPAVTQVSPCGWLGRPQEDAGEIIVACWSGHAGPLHLRRAPPHRFCSPTPRGAPAAGAMGTGQLDSPRPRQVPT